eukprot:CAMPEP_0171181338 /NCGR_PEP_ID=MMETSP0790-20130122/14209_1 /TAXON_ID=2925 /ORGANISM="Alexandrium catenella, Strain OF101" /LENGTH=84 /DNA_ID=CAMNT_0011646275 /DNA_START=60 /DNA_END=311 /DNA_ORIENTATION=-
MSKMSRLCLIRRGQHFGEAAVDCRVEVCDVLQDCRNRLRGSAAAGVLELLSREKAISSGPRNAALLLGEACKRPPFSREPQQGR